jgi:hypothetical protein
MALKIYLQGQNVHLEKTVTLPVGTFVQPMADLSYSITNSMISIRSKELGQLCFELSNNIQDIDDATLASDAAVHAYLGQFIGAMTLANGSSATVSSVASVATTDTLLLAANEQRTSVLLWNNSTSTLYVKYGTGASTTSFTHIVVAASTVALPVTGYKGILHFYHSALNGTIEVTEVHV